MKYSDGQIVRLGDRVAFKGDSLTGVVVFSIDTDEYSPEFPRADWSRLARGIMLLTDEMGLVHHEEADEDMILVERATQP